MSDNISNWMDHRKIDGICTCDIFGTKKMTDELPIKKTGHVTLLHSINSEDQYDIIAGATQLPTNFIVPFPFTLTLRPFNLYT